MSLTHISERFPTSIYLFSRDSSPSSL